VRLQRFQREEQGLVSRENREVVRHRSSPVRKRSLSLPAEASVLSSFSFFFVFSTNTLNYELSKGLPPSKKGEKRNDESPHT